MLYKNEKIVGTSLAVQWLRLRASNAGGAGSIPGWGTEILHAVRCSQKKKRKEKEKIVNVTHSERRKLGCKRINRKVQVTCNHQGWLGAQGEVHRAFRGDPTPRVQLVQDTTPGDKITTEDRKSVV